MAAPHVQGGHGLMSLPCCVLSIHKAWKTPPVARQKIDGPFLNSSFSWSVTLLEKFTQVCHWARIGLPLIFPDHLFAFFSAWRRGAFRNLDWTLITTYPFTPLRFKVFWILHQDYPQTGFGLCQLFLHRSGNLPKPRRFWTNLLALACLVLNISQWHLEHSVRN